MSRAEDQSDHPERATKSDTPPTLPPDQVRPRQPSLAFNVIYSSILFSGIDGDGGYVTSKQMHLRSSSVEGPEARFWKRNSVAK